MTIYIALFNLTEAGIKAAKDLPRRLDAAKKLLADMGGEMANTAIRRNAANGAMRPGSPNTFAPPDAGLTNCAPDAHVDAILCHTWVLGRARSRIAKGTAGVDVKRATALNCLKRADSRPSKRFPGMAGFDFKADIVDCDGERCGWRILDI